MGARGHAGSRKVLTSDQSNTLFQIPVPCARNLSLKGLLVVSWQTRQKNPSIVGEVLQFTLEGG